MYNEYLYIYIYIHNDYVHLAILKSFIFTLRKFKSLPYQYNMKKET